MRVAKSTKARIAIIKSEAVEVKQRLENLRARLEEHSGTKRIVKKLEVVIDKLEEWQKAA